MKLPRIESVSWAVFFARMWIGLQFLMLRWEKVFNLTEIDQARRLFVDQFQDTWIPVFILWTIGIILPFLELIAGSFAFIGLRVKESIVTLGLILLIITYGHLLGDKFYDFTTFVIPQLVMIIFVLMIPRDKDVLSVDHLLSKKK